MFHRDPSGKKRYVRKHLPLNEAQDQAQENFFGVQGQIQRLNELKKLPKSSAVVMQIRDLESSIKKTLDFFQRTGQSLDFLQQKDDAIIKQAELITAQNIVEQNHKGAHKMVDLIDEKRFHNQQILEQNNQLLNEEFKFVSRDGYTPKEIIHNLKNLIKMKENETRDYNQIVENRADPLIDYQPIGSEYFKNEDMENLVLAKAPPVFSEEQRIEQEPTMIVESYPPLTRIRILTAEQIKEKIKEGSDLDRGEMFRYLRDNQYLTRAGKFKNRKLEKYAEQRLIDHETTEDQQKQIRDLIAEFKRLQ